MIVRKFLEDETGASAVEYAFIAAATAAALIVVRPHINAKLQEYFQAIASQWP